MTAPDAPSPVPDDRRTRPTTPAAREGGDARLTPLRELQLVDDFLAGDVEAAGRLLSGYQRRIYAVCYRMVRHPDEAADLTQESIVKVLEGLRTYNRRAKLSTWIIRVTMNCCLSHLRKQKLRRHASLDEAEGPENQPRSARLADRSEPGPGRRVEQDELRTVLLRSLSCLEPEMRAVLVLRDLQDLDYQQIADVLDVPVGTVKSRLFRARAALRDQAEREGARWMDSRRA